MGLIEARVKNFSSPLLQWDVIKTIPRHWNVYPSMIPMYWKLKSILHLLKGSPCRSSRDPAFSFLEHFWINQLSVLSKEEEARNRKHSCE